MGRPRQVVPLLVGGAGMWLVHLTLVLTSQDRDVVTGHSSSVLAIALANLAFWLGVLLIGAGLLLLVLALDRGGRGTVTEEPSGVDHYA